MPSTGWLGESWKKSINLRNGGYCLWLFVVNPKRRKLHPSRFGFCRSHQKRQLYGKMAEPGLMQRSWKPSCVMSAPWVQIPLFPPWIAAHFYGDGDHENQSWQSEETIIWRCTQCWQRGQFAKLLGRRNMMSGVGTHHLRQMSTQALRLLWVYSWVRKLIPTAGVK